VDGLRGLKENVILGKLIPARVLDSSPDEKGLTRESLEQKELALPELKSQQEFPD